MNEKFIGNHVNIQHIDDGFSIGIGFTKEYYGDFYLWLNLFKIQIYIGNFLRKDDKHGLD